MPARCGRSGRGFRNSIFRWLDKAWANGDPGVQLLLYDPILLRYQHDPRFAAFCRKVNLPVPGVDVPALPIVPWPAAASTTAQHP